MLLELLETIPFIIVTVINLLIVGKTIYRLLNHKSILDNSRDIDCRFYIYPFFCFTAYVIQRREQFVEDYHGSI